MDSQYEDDKRIQQWRESTPKPISHDWDGKSASPGYRLVERTVEYYRTIPRGGDSIARPHSTAPSLTSTTSATSSVSHSAIARYPQLLMPPPSPAGSHVGSSTSRAIARHVPAPGTHVHGNGNQSTGGGLTSRHSNPPPADQQQRPASLGPSTRARDSRSIPRAASVVSRNSAVSQITLRPDDPASQASGTRSYAASQRDLPCTRR